MSHKKGFQPRPANARKAAETKIPLKKATASNFALLGQEVQRTKAAAESAHRELINAATLILNENDIDEGELVRVEAATKTTPAQLVVIVKKRSKG